MQDFKLPTDATGRPVEIGRLSAGLVRSISGASQREALPTGAEVVTLVAGTDSAFKFGDSSVVVAATDGNFDGVILAGERISVQAPPGSTHVAVISITLLDNLFISKLN